MSGSPGKGEYSKGPSSEEAWVDDLEVRVTPGLWETSPPPDAWWSRALTPLDRRLRQRRARRALMDVRVTHGMNGVHELMQRRLEYRFYLSPTLAHTMAQGLLWQAPVDKRAQGELEDYLACAIEADAQALKPIFERAVDQLRVRERVEEAFRDIQTHGVGDIPVLSTRGLASAIRQALARRIGKDALVVRVDVQERGQAE